MPRSIAKKIALGFAWLCLVGALASIAGFWTSAHSRGMHDPITASMLATIVFFVSCTVVLYAMSKPPRHPLEPWDAPTGERKDGAD